MDRTCELRKQNRVTNNSLALPPQKYCYGKPGMVDRTNSVYLLFETLLKTQNTEVEFDEADSLKIISWANVDEWVSIGTKTNKYLDISSRFKFTATANCIFLIHDS